jgi:hypothetical protein
MDTLPTYSWEYTVLDAVHLFLAPCRCGALHVGDQILAVDETRVDGVTTTAADVMQLLRNINSPHITLEILPLSQLNCGWRLSENSVRSRGRAI